MTTGAQYSDDVSREGGQSPAERALGQDVQGGSAMTVTSIRPRYSVRRVLCGIWWLLGTALCTVGAIAALFGGHFLQFLGTAALAGVLGWYDYRIWTFKAKWLMFLIIF